MSNTYWMDHQDIASKCQMKILGPFCRYLARIFFKATLTMSLDADEKLTRFDFLRYYLAEIGDDLCLVIYQPTDSSNAVSSLHFDNTGVFRLNKMRHALDSGSYSVKRENKPLTCKSPALCTTSLSHNAWNFIVQMS